jgi:hypothetical protein
MIEWLASASIEKALAIGQCHIARQVRRSCGAPWRTGFNRYGQLICCAHEFDDDKPLARKPLSRNV